MPECEAAVVLSAILAVSGLGPFSDSDKGFHFISFPSFIFLTSVFSWISVKEINLFAYKLPKIINFIYEVVMSSLIFELAFKVFWRPLERLVMTGLPLAVDKYLMKGQCTWYDILCPGDTRLYTACLYVMAVLTLLVTLYGNGFIAVSPNNCQNPRRVPNSQRRSARLRC